MYSYSLWQWIALFAVYCFFGWIYESTYVSIEHKKLVNRGFLNGPFLPIYGFGAIIILFCSLPVRNNIVLVFLLGGLGATILEYFTGLVMESMFHVRYWDYTRQPLNLNGYICLGCSLMWGGLSIVLTSFLHKPVEKILLSANNNQVMFFDVLFLAYFSFDMYLSTKAAFDLRKIIDEQILQNEKVLRLQKRLDVMIAFANDDMEQLKERFNDEIDDITDYFSEKKEKFTDYINEAKLEAENLKSELTKTIEGYEQRTKKRMKRAMLVLRRNPSTSSVRHKLNKYELRTLFKDYINKRK